MGNITATQAFTWTVTPLRLDNPGPDFDDAGDEVDLSRIRATRTRATSIIR